MILGAGRLQIPAIKVLKKMGYKVIAVDYDEKAIGFALSDIQLLVSTIDQEEVYKQALLYEPDVIMTSTSDAPVKSVAYVNEKLGKRLDISYEDAICATNKAFMRKRLKSHGIPIPKFYIVNNYSEFIIAIKNFNDVCIVKPADNAGSRGVKLLNLGDKTVNLKERYESTKKHSRTGVVLVEEYMTGKEVSVETMTVDGENFILGITDKEVTQGSVFVEIGHSVQSQLSDDIKKEIKRITIDAIRAINIINGPSHTEIKMTPQGPKIVEIAARLGGDFITSKLIPLSTGINMVESSVLLAMGEQIDLNTKYDRGSAIRFIYATDKGVIKSIDIDDTLKEIEGIDEIELYKNTGDYIQNLESSDDRIGHVISKADTALHAIEIAEQALAKIKVHI